MFTGITPDKKLQTIEIDRHIHQPEGTALSATVAGQLTFKEVFEMLKSHFDYLGFFDEKRGENFIFIEDSFSADENVPKNWDRFVVEKFAYPNRMGINIYLMTDEGIASDSIMRGNYPYPVSNKQALEDLQLISEQAERMLNGNGEILELPEYIAEYVDYIEEIEDKIAYTQKLLAECKLIDSTLEEAQELIKKIDNSEKNADEICELLEQTGNKISEAFNLTTEIEGKLIRAGLVNGESESFQSEAAAYATEIDHHNDYEDEGLTEDDEMEL